MAKSFNNKIIKIAKNMKYMHLERNSLIENN